MIRQEDKVAAAVGYNIRMALNGEWRLTNTLHRSVAIRKICKEDNDFQKCVDCNSPSEFLAVELTRFTPKGKRSRYPLVWGWCGVCDLGES